jgi:hypothetical protein
LKKVRKALKNVNKTYGINLEDIQAEDDSINDDDEGYSMKTLTAPNKISENFNEFLQR